MILETVISFAKFTLEFLVYSFATVVTLGIIFKNKK